MNISKMSLNKDVIKSDNQTGFYVGPTVKISLPLSFGLDIAALYDQRSADVETGTSAASGSSQTTPATGTEKITQKTLNIPVVLNDVLVTSECVWLGMREGVYQLLLNENNKMKDMGIRHFTDYILPYGNQ